MFQVEEHEILSIVGRNDLNQLENIGTSNIFITFLFNTFIKIDQINPTNKLTASMHPSLYNTMVAFLSFEHLITPSSIHFSPLWFQS